jgi:hypothetical protein
MRMFFLRFMLAIDIVAFLASCIVALVSIVAWHPLPAIVASLLAVGLGLVGGRIAHAAPEV